MFLKIFLILYFLITSSVLTADNLVFNGNFETGPISSGDTPIPGWNIRGFKHVLPFHHITQKNAHSGISSALISIPESSPSDTVAYFSPSGFIPLESGKNYEISFWSKALSGNGCFRGVRYDSEKKFCGMGSILTHPVKSDPNVRTWKRHCIEFQTPEIPSGGYFLKIYLQGEGPCEIYFDDLHIRKTASRKFRTLFYPSSAESQKKLYPVQEELLPLFIYTYSAVRQGSFDLILDLPSAVDLLAAEVLYRSASKTLLLSDIRAASADRHTIRLRLSKDIIMPMGRYSSGCHFGTGILLKNRDSWKKDFIGWKIENKGSILDSGKLTLLPLAADNGRLPKRFSIINWYSPLLSYLQSPNTLRQYLTTFQKSKFIAGSIESNHHHNIFNEMKFGNFNCFALSIPKDCLTGMLTGTVLERYLQSMYKNNLAHFDLKIANWNFEPSMKNYYHLCPDCKRAFKAFSGKSAEHFSDGRALEKAYPEDFLNFRCKQHFDLMKKYHTICRSLNIKSSICCYARSSSKGGQLRIKKMVGNQEEYFPFLDYITPMIYARPENLWDILQYNRNFYHGINYFPTYTTDERCGGNSPAYSLLTPESIYLETIMAAIQGFRKEIFFIGHHTLDGRQIKALRQALHEIAILEDYFFDGSAEPQHIKKHSSSESVRFRFLKKGKEYLLAVINPDQYHPGQLEFSINHGPDVFTLYNPLSFRVLQHHSGNRCNFRKNEKINLHLPPSSTLFLLLSSQTESAYPGADKFRAAPPVPIHPAQVILNSPPWKCSLQNDILSIENSIKHLRLLLKDGGVLVWDDIYYPAHGKGGFGRDLFHYPTAAAWGPDSRAKYSLQSCTQRNGNIILTLEHKCLQPELKGLLIQKIFTIEKKMHTINTAIHLCNQSDKTKILSYWNHNRPDLNPENTEIRINDKKFSISSNRSSPNLRISADSNRSAHIRPFGQMTWSGEPLDQFYFWVGDSQISVEFISRQILLKSGEKKIINIQYKKNENK